MPTLTATGFNAEGYVLVIADWTGAPSVTYAGVRRRNTVTGETVLLRPHGAFDADGNLLLNCGIGIWWDTEPPLNVPLEYCTFAADVATILNSNPGFETGVGPWTPFSGTLVQSALNVHSGAFSGLYTATGGTSSGINSGVESYTILAGEPFTISAWIYSTAGWNGAQIRLLGTGSDFSSQVFSTSTFMLPAAEYRYISGVFTSGVNITSPRIFALLNGNLPAAATFHFDDVRVEQNQAVAATACDTVTITTESLFLKSPLHPCSDLTLDLCDPAYGECAADTGRVSYAGMGDDEYDPNTVVLYPANRKFPIAINRQRRSVRSTLALITHDYAAKDAVIAINDPGDPLLFQDGTGDYCLEDRYMSVDTVAIRHIGVDQRDEFRFISMPYVAVERPEGVADGPCGTRFSDLCDIYGTWAALELSDLDWIDLPTGGASNESPGDEPPAAARTWDEVEAEFVDWDAVEAGGTRDWDELRDGL